MILIRILPLVHRMIRSSRCSVFSLCLRLYFIKVFQSSGITEMYSDFILKAVSLSVSNGALLDTMQGLIFNLKVAGKCKACQFQYFLFSDLRSNKMECFLECKDNCKEGILWLGCNIKKKKEHLLLKELALLPLWTNAWLTFMSELG